jgi:hypothetical protein
MHMWRASGHHPETVALEWLDMGIIRSTAALVGWLGFGMLALGALSQPLRNGMAQRTTPAPDTTVVPLPVKTVAATAPVSLGRASRDWSVEIDEATLTRNLNGWASAQPPVQTPLGMARLEDLTVALRDDQVVLKGTAQAAWVRAPVDLLASASVQSGHAHIQLWEAHLNGVQVPEVVRRQLEQQLQGRLDQSVGAYHVIVRSVRVSVGVLVVSGTQQYRPVGP